MPTDRISISTAANPTAIGDDASGGVRILQPDNQIRSIKNGSLINCQVQSGSIIIGVNDGATTKINNSVSGAQLTGQAGLSGGGLITWSGTKTVSGTTYLKWGARVNVMPVQRDELAFGGFYEATCPGAGVQITYYPSTGGTTTTTCTSDGVPLKAFEALYYELPSTPAGSSSSNDRYRVVHFENTTWTPDGDYVLLAIWNLDCGLRWLPSQVLFPHNVVMPMTYDTASDTDSWSLNEAARSTWAGGVPFYTNLGKWITTNANGSNLTLKIYYSGNDYGSVNAGWTEATVFFSANARRALTSGTAPLLYYNSAGSWVSDTASIFGEGVFMVNSGAALGSSELLVVPTLVSQVQSGAYNITRLEYDFWLQTSGFPGHRTIVPITSAADCSWTTSTSTATPTTAPTPGWLRLPVVQQANSLAPPSFTGPAEVRLNSGNDGALRILPTTAGSATGLAFYRNITTTLVNTGDLSGRRT
jgi:hypothetical protein